MGDVLAAVHHAEVIAHRVGDPVGSLVLAVAVTIIEVALIVTLMVSGSDHASTLARDTVFAAVMLSLAADRQSTVFASSSSAARATVRASWA